MVKRRADGTMDFIALPSPFNYGSVVGTMAPDGDPLDVIELGPRLRRGVRVERVPRAVFGFVDEGALDPKVVCSAAPLQPGQRRAVERFFWVYSRFKRGLARARGRTGVIETLGWLPWVHD